MGQLNGGDAKSTPQFNDKAHRSTQNLHQTALANAEVLGKQFSVAEAILKKCPPELRRWEWAYLRRLSNPQQAHYRDLSETRITKSGLKELTRLKKLQVLSLEGLEFGDAEVELLPAFEGLKKLSLHNNRVTDAGMKTIGRLKELRRLSLVSTKVTGEGLQLLATCSKLEMIDLYDTKVTREGTEALRKDLPNCVVTRSFSYGGIPDLKITRAKTGVILETPEDGWP